MKAKLIILILLLSIILSGCLTSAIIQQPPEAEQREVDFGPCPDDYMEKIGDYFGAKLVYPYSMVISFVSPVKHKDAGQYGWKVAVRINAKNRQGEYTGVKHHRFFFRGDKMRPIDRMWPGLKESAQ